MLIEGAFMKIPEVLDYYGDEHYLYKSSISHLFSNSIILELNARNIDNPLNKLLFEKRYNPLVNKRCDIYCYFDFLNDNLYNYGYYRENFIEVKYFGNLDKRKGTETKSENAGRIMCDIHRLTMGTKEIDKKGLYSLVIFDDHPSKYLAFSRANGIKRKWIETILTPGVHKLEFNLKEEPKTIKDIFKADYFYEEDLRIEENIRVTSFSPVEKNEGYYGYLIQII